MDSSLLPLHSMSGGFFIDWPSLSYLFKDTIVLTIHTLKRCIDLGSDTRVQSETGS